MDFVQSVKTCYSKYATFSGVASRSEFWWFFLAAMLINWIIAAIFGATSTLTSIVELLVTGIPTLAVGARRLRDAGFSPWWWLIALTGIGLIALLIMWALKKK